MLSENKLGRGETTTLTEVIRKSDCECVGFQIALYIDYRMNIKTKAENGYMLKLQNHKVSVDLFTKSQFTRTWKYLPEN